VPDLALRARGEARAGAWTLPLPGGGATPRRWRALCGFGREDLSLARIAEAHADAIAILAASARMPRVGALYGVWASDGPQSRLQAHRAGGAWRLDGLKQYCSGAPFVQAALVTAHTDNGLMLFDVALDAPGIAIEASAWANPGMAATATGPVRFHEVRVDAAGTVGGPGWYLHRPGFWHGAIGPAACWAGGALFLIDAARALDRRDPHSRAQRGALEAACWELGTLLDAAGREIDADPDDAGGQARRRALIVRHLIERICTDVLDRFGRATGPQLLAHDARVAQQHAALGLYIRQCHAERDLAEIPGD
jgi:alkylation response protein AidB-like acyl-CoA dehydrogenase